MRNIVLNYARYSGTHRRIKCDRTEPELSLLLYHSIFYALLQFFIECRQLTWDAPKRIYNHVMLGDLGGHSVGPCHPIYLRLKVTCKTRSRTVQAQGSAAFADTFQLAHCYPRYRDRLNDLFISLPMSWHVDHFGHVLPQGNININAPFVCCFSDSSSPVGVASLTPVQVCVCARMRKYHLRSWTVGIPWTWRHYWLSSILPWRNHSFLCVTKEWYCLMSLLA